MRALVLAAAFVLAAADSPQAVAEQVPFSCTVLPDGESASLMLTNPFDHEASCLVTCQFSTAKVGVRPHITCTKPVPAGKEVQMCILTSPGEKLQAMIDSRGDCTR